MNSVKNTILVVAIFLVQLISKKRAAKLWMGKGQLFQNATAFRIIRRLKTLPFLKIGECYLFIDPYTVIGQSVLTHGGFENFEEEFLKNHLNRYGSDTIFDIGANIGIFSIPLARALKLKKIIAFEPARSTVNQLRKNVAANGLQNRFVIENLAVSNSLDEITFYEYDDNAYNSLKQHDRGLSKSQYLVSTTTIDEYCRIHDVRPDFIKVDVEGNEANVLGGAEKYINENKPDLFVEVFDRAIPPIGAKKIIEDLKQKGYFVYVFQYDGLKCFEGEHNNTFQNYLFTIKDDILG